MQTAKQLNEAPSFVQIGHKVFVYENHLKANGINRNTIYNGWKNAGWQYQELSTGRVFDIDSLTPIAKKVLPSHADIYTKHLSEAINTDVANLTAKFEDLKTRGFTKYIAHIKNSYPDMPTERKTEAAQRMAVWNFIFTNYEQRKRGLLDLYHKAYTKVFPEHLTHKVKFSAFINNCINNGVEYAVIDGRWVYKAEKRTSDNQYAFVKLMVMDDRKFSSKQIHSKLIGYCAEINETPISHSTVKSHIRDLKKDTTVYGARYGADALKQRMPYVTSEAARHIHDQWQMDGVTLPFFGTDLSRWVMVAIMDNHSRKVIGYAVGKTENTELILEAIADAMRNANGLPAEIVTDKHAFHRTDIAANFRAKCDKLGIAWTISTNPQSKAILERSFGAYFDPHFKEYSGYIGKGIASKSKDARRSPETMKGLIKPENWHTVDELKAIAASVVLKHNNTAINPLKGLSPIEAYNNSIAEHLIHLSTAEQIDMLKPANKYKVSRGQINIKVGTVKHEFQLPANLISKYNNEYVLVVYEDLAQGIYITDIKTGEMLGCIEPKKKITTVLVNKTAEDRQNLNKHSGRVSGVVKQTSQTNNQRIHSMLLQNPDAMDFITPHTIPKDIRQEIEQNRELRRAAMDLGVNVNKLPIRTQKSPALAVVAAMPKKAKNSPFTPIANQTKAFDLNSFLNDLQ